MPSASALINAAFGFARFSIAVLEVFNSAMQEAT